MSHIIKITFILQIYILTNYRETKKIQNFYDENPQPLQRLCICLQTCYYNLLTTVFFFYYLRYTYINIIPLVICSHNLVENKVLTNGLLKVLHGLFL